MKIKTWIEPAAYEADVEIGIEDITNALAEDGDTPEAAFRAINRCAAVLKGVTSAIIADMNKNQRSVICDFLTAQAARYQQPADTGKPEGGE